MAQHNFNNPNTLPSRLSEYEYMSQKGTVGFFEEKVFLDFVKYYEQEDALDKALAVIDHALEQHSYSANLHVYKARMLMEFKEESQALEFLNRAHALSPSDVDIQILRSEVLTFLGHHEEALVAIEHVNQQIDQLPEQLYLCRAYIYEQQANFDALFLELQQYLLLDPHDEESLKHIMFCVEVTEKYKESVQFHLTLIDKAPYSYMAWCNLGHAYAAIEDYVNAADAFEYAFLIKGKFVHAYKAFAKMCFKLKDYGRALRAFEDLLDQLETPDADLLTNIGECYEHLHKFELAHIFYNKSKKVNHQSSYNYYRIGECYVKQQLWSKAISAYKKAYKLDDRKEEFQLALADVYFQIGDDENAKFYFQKAVDTAPDTPICWVQYASFLMDIGALEDALAVLEEANDYGINAHLLYCKVSCLFLMNNRLEAIQLLRQALDDYYNQHDILFQFAPEIEGDSDIAALINLYNRN